MGLLSSTFLLLNLSERCPFSDGPDIADAQAKTHNEGEETI